MLAPSGFCVWGALMPYANILTSVCVPQVCLFVHVCAQPMAVRGPQSNPPLWSPGLLEASAPPHFFCNSPLWPRVRGLHLSERTGAAAESRGYPFALGSKGHVGVLGPSHPHASRRPRCSAAYLLACPTWTCSQPQTSCARFCPKEIRPRAQCGVWSPALCGAEGFRTCGWRLLYWSSLLFSLP